MTKHIELAAKIKALADKGIGGEKVNAQKLLESLMKKHNLTIEDIEGEKKKDYSFQIQPADMRLFCQVTHHVNYTINIYGPIPGKMIKEYNLKGNFLINCTASEYIEIEAAYNLYSRHYKVEEDIFFVAFCIKNDLLVDEPFDRDLDQKTLGKYLRANSMAWSIRKEISRKQLNSKKS